MLPRRCDQQSRAGLRARPQAPQSAVDLVALLVRGIYMHERCRHECIRMQMYALVVDEMPMLMCSKYFMRNDTYAVDESLYRYVRRVNCANL